MFYGGPYVQSLNSFWVTYKITHNYLSLSDSSIEPYMYVPPGTERFKVKVKDSSIVWCACSSDCA